MSTHDPYPTTDRDDDWANPNWKVDSQIRQCCNGIGDHTRECAMDKPAISILRHDGIDPAEVDPHQGWRGVVLTAVSGRVAGELVHCIDLDGTVTHPAHIHLNRNPGGCADIELYEADTLRGLSAVAGLLADEMTAAQKVGSAN